MGCLVVVKDFLDRHSVILQWALPVGLLLVVLLIALAPGVIGGAVGLVALFLLAYVGVPLYYRRYQERNSRNGSSG
jgi:hypothetical protein